MKNFLIFILFITAINANITVYNAYSAFNKSYINGRLIKNEQTVSSKNDSIFKNIANQVKLFFHNELKNKTIYLNTDNKIYKTKSDDEGYFSITVNQSLQNALLYLDSKNFIKVSFLNYKEPRIGIISDFDDTLVISNVPNKLKLLQNNFTKNYKQRVLIKRTATKIKDILKNNKDAPFIIVSGSPYQFYTPIKNFLAYHNFPKAVILLKQIHGKNKEPNNQFKYKVAKIEKVFKQFPKTKWYLFGDSGEKDKEVYNYFKQRYPQRIIAIYIRELN